MPPIHNTTTSSGNQNTKQPHQKNQTDENWEEAICALESCIKVKPTYSAAIFALAQCLKNNKQHDRCHEACIQVIEIARTNGDLLVIKNLEELRDSLG